MESFESENPTEPVATNPETIQETLEETTDEVEQEESPELE